MIRHNSFHQEMIFITVLLLQFPFLNAAFPLQLVAAPNFTVVEFMEHIKLVDDEDDWYTGQNAQYNNEAIWLNQDPNQAQTKAASNIGKIIYKDKVQFKYAGYGMISFGTSFTFQFITTNPYPNCGSGMVFFVADYYKAPERSYGRYFGLVSPTRTNSFRFFAVEFDTHITDEFADTSASHVGIDINSLESLVHMDSNNSSSPYFPELYLYSNTTFTAWIEYDAQNTLIQVWMSRSNLKPLAPCVSLKYNLSNDFQDYMYVGFSATSNASEDGMEGLALFAWNLTVYPPDRDRKKDKLLIDLPVGLSGLVLLCVCSVCFCQIFKTVEKKKFRVSNELQMRKANRAFVENLICHATLKEYSFEELLVASKNFSESNEVGEGNFGIVYKATLADGKTVAIKRLKGGCRKELEFSAEIGVISNIRHKNLLPLRGWCYEKGEALLVYDYMRRGSLSRYLYGKDGGALSSKVRLGILEGVAAALEYLHESLGDCVLHRDVKAANVLLAEDWTPVLGDFGLARLIRHSEHSVAMTVAGSPGYIAPEVVFSNKVTDKADVYSFGVLLLVVAGGRPALLEPASMSRAPGPSEFLLVDWIWDLHESNRLMEALDPRMAKAMTEEETQEWRRALHIALACIQPSPKMRPSMRQVLQAVQGEDFGWMQAPLERRSGCWEEASSVCEGTAAPCVDPLSSSSYAQMSFTLALEGR